MRRKRRTQSMKVEAIHGEGFRTREQMRRAVFDYIEVDYNRNCRHLAHAARQSVMEFTSRSADGGGVYSAMTS